MPQKRAAQPAVPWEITDSMFLSEDEVDSLLEYVRGLEQLSEPAGRIRAEVDRLIVEILLFSGLRNSELCRLRVCDVKSGSGQSLIEIVGASKQGRVVYIPSALGQAITRFVKRSRRKLVTAGVSPDDDTQMLILNERGRPYDRTALYRRVVRILTAAGLEARASVQLLRHTYGYLAYKRTGGNLLFVQQQLGHSHPMVTAIYAQFVKFSFPELANSVNSRAT